MDRRITVERYSFWKENRIQLGVMALCLSACIFGLAVGSNGAAALNALVVILNALIVYRRLPPKWVRKEMKVMKRHK